MKNPRESLNLILTGKIAGPIIVCLHCYIDKTDFPQETCSLS